MYLRAAVPAPAPVREQNRMRSRSGGVVRLTTLAVPLLVVAGAARVLRAGAGNDMASLLFGLAVGSLLLVLNSPAWALVPLVIVEFSIANMFVPGVGAGTRMVATVAVALITLIAVPKWRSRLSTLMSGPALRRVLVPAVAFVVMATLGNLLFSETDYVMQYLRYQVVLLLTFLITVCVVQDRNDLRRVFLAILIIGLASALASIWQYVAPASARYGGLTAAEAARWGNRLPGLSWSPVALANQMTWVLMPLLGVLLILPFRWSRAHLLLLAATFAAAASLYFTYTRSVIPAVGVGLAAMGLFLKSGRQMAVFACLIGGALLFPYIGEMGLLGSDNRYFADTSQDGSAASHTALWEVGLAIALDNPIFGVGHQHFEDVSPDYLHEVSVDPGAESGEGAIGRDRPHNDFLAVWMGWGIFALIAYVGVFAGSIANCVRAAREGDLLIRGLAVGCAGALITYAVNSLFHNYMDSTTLLWMYAGLSVALASQTPSGLAGYAGLRRGCSMGSMSRMQHPRRHSVQPARIRSAGNRVNQPAIAQRSS